MNLLIVDDEFYSVEGIYEKLQGAHLGFANIFRAYSFAQAQTLFSGETIDILITDIEMPKGSGLDLVAWIRDGKHPTVCIFLTSFATFDYASTAVKLQGFDYLLKPVEEQALIDCVRRAIARAEQIAEEGRRQAQASKWQSARVQLVEQFWHELIEGALPSEPAFIADHIARKGLPPEYMDTRFFPILLRCRRDDGEGTWNRHLFEFAQKNILSEIFFGEEEIPAIVRISEPYYLIAAPYAQDRGTLMEKCQRALTVCGEHLAGRFCFFVYGDCGISEMRETAHALLAFARQQLDTRSCVRDASRAQAPQTEVLRLPADAWAELLLMKKTDALLEEARAFLNALHLRDNASRDDLTHFYHDFMQITYSAMDRNGAAAHQLFDRGLPATPLENACDSIENMRLWVEQVLANYRACMDAVSHSSNAIQTVCQYIRGHLADDLTRDLLAATVFLSPDYLSHVFREKTGKSLTGYIMEQRIRHAKELLLQGDRSVRDIALMSGFQNISYFSKQFKRATGKTPQAYRKPDQTTR